MLICDKILEFKNGTNEECFVDLHTHIKVIALPTRQEVILRRDQITKEDINEVGEILFFEPTENSKSEIEQSISRIVKFVMKKYQKKVTFEKFRKVV